MEKSSPRPSLIDAVKRIPGVVLTLIWIALCIVAFIFCYAFLWAPHVHAWGEWMVVREATCTEEGERIQYCECGETQSEVIPAAGHSLGEWTVVKEASCTERGERARVCVCGERETKIITQLPHNYSDVQLIREATRTEDGERVRSCACGEKKTEVIDATGSLGLKYTLQKSGYNLSGIGSCKDKDVIIPKKYNGQPVVSIGDPAFSDCKQLTSVTIPDGVMVIGASAFASCEGLTSITLPGSITTIGNRAFASCTGLTSITIPGSVRNIGSGPFSGCLSLEKIEVAADNPYYESNENCLIMKASGALISGNKTGVIPADGSIKSIGEGAFSFLKNLTSVVIPSGVTGIGKDAFSICVSLEHITIPNSVTSIGDYAFDRCYALTDITYTGTKAEWNALRKGFQWDDATANYTVHCTDGDITK